MKSHLKEQASRNNYIIDETKNIVYNTIQEMSFFPEEYWNDDIEGPVIKMALKN
jgi:hypothetical protein